MQTRSFLRQALLATAAAVTLCGMAPAQATLFQTGGFIIGPDNVNVTAPSYAGGAGGFHGIWDPTGAALGIDYWCYQLDQEFSPGTTYDYTASILNNPAISELFSEAGGMALTSAKNSAAFQLAIWELEYDSDHNVVNPGAFYAISADAGVIAQAQTWLEGLPTSSNIVLVLLHSDTNQDFITAFPIPSKDLLPEPSSLPLLGLGLAAMIFVGSRRPGTKASRS